MVLPTNLQRKEIPPDDLLKKLFQFGGGFVKKINTKLHAVLHPHSTDDEFAKIIYTTVADAIKNQSAFGKLENKVVDSNYGYISGYTPILVPGVTLEQIITDMEAQCKTLGDVFGMRTSFNKDWVVSTWEAGLPTWVEKFFVQIPWQIFAPSYSKAVEIVLAMIKESRNSEFKNFHEGKIIQSPKSANAWEMLDATQKAHGYPYNCLVVPAQFGIHHRVGSILRVREMFFENEFGLGALAVGTMLLTHSKQRLNHNDDLWIDCVGDESAPNADIGFSHGLSYGFNDGQVGFGDVWVDYDFSNCGSASAFIPLSM